MGGASHNDPFDTVLGDSHLGGVGAKEETALDLFRDLVVLLKLIG